MNWRALVLAALPYLVQVDASCTGLSDDCPSNPSPLRRFNPLNFHVKTCDFKWTHGCTILDKHGGLQQKPPPFSLCNSKHRPSGLLATDAYTLALQKNDFAPGSPSVTLHGLWPGSINGRGAKNQPMGCQHGEEFDESYLTTFGSLLKYYWPTDAQYNNTMSCFILSEWMKHGTCAVIPGADGTAFRLPQEAYYRTAFVLANEYNVNPVLQEQLQELEPLVSTSCVQCAYLATVGWTETTVASVPRMSSDCIDQCFACGDDWDTCPPAQLDSTVLYDPSNAPESSSTNASMPLMDFGMPALSRNIDGDVSPWIGTWRSFGAEQIGSGKFEFAQTFTEDTLTVTTDSPYPQTCTYEIRSPGELVLQKCGKEKNHLEECLVQRLPDIGGLEVAFLACNHTGAPAPASFDVAMDSPGCGNFLMFRCKSSSEGCAFLPDISPAASLPASKHEASKDKPAPSPNQPGIAGAPPALLGVWRSLQVSENYQEGLARWNFSSDGQAALKWMNYPSRGEERYAVTRSEDDDDLVYLASTSGSITTCRFHFQYDAVYSYAVLDCGAPNQVAPDLAASFLPPHTQWAMGRCNPCSSSCRYSCGKENNYCGAGPCDSAADSVPSNTLPGDAQKHLTGVAESKPSHNWCTPGDSSCWPTKTAIQELEQELDPKEPRLGLQWSSYPQPQPAPVPTGSVNNQSFYGLGDTPTGFKALYYYEDVNEMQRPCFKASANSTEWNHASDMCKASLHQNEYRDWNPFIVVFPLNEQHVASALTFAARHRLCIATSGTGHEYNSRNSCPTGGILIRTILFKDKAFLPRFDEDPTLAPHGAFKFGAGAVFAEMHAFSAQYNRVIASGWCSTVGMVGFHLGGGHGPFAPSMGLGVDNVLEIEVLQIGQDGAVHKKAASRRHNSDLFWAMRGGGGGVWGVVLSMTIRAHGVPDGGLSRVFMPQNGTFCPGSGEFGYEWLRTMWRGFSAWNLMLNQKVSTQAAFFIDTSNYTKGGLCAVTWQFNFEYFYAGGQLEPDYIRFRDKLNDVLGKPAVTETNFKSAYEYILSMPADKFLLAVFNPLPAPHPPSDNATGSQNSVFVSRQAMESKFARTMMNVLDICAASLKDPDPTSPAPGGSRCGFHYLYTSLTGNRGSTQPASTAISPGFRSAIMLWNARTLSTKQMEETLYKIGPNSYFSESSYVMHDWTERYWGEDTYRKLLAVKKMHDTGDRFWCHHCVGDDPNDAYGEPLGVAGR
ncbi:hypothetical protein ACHAPE_007860 [Trichoderma viride]